MSLVKAHWLVAGTAGAIAIVTPYALLRKAPQPLPTPVSFTPTPLGVRPVSTLDAAFLMPLFSVDRAPASASDPTLAIAAGAVPAAPPAPPPKLVGIALASRGRGVVLVRQVDGQTRTLHQGEDADGWRLIAIARASAKFRLGTDTQTLTLDFSNKTQSGAATAQIPLPPPSSSSAPLSLPTTASDPMGTSR